MFSDADAAALYDLLNPWDPDRRSNPDDVVELVDATGRALRVWHEVDAVIGDVVTFHGTTAEPDGTVLRVDSASLRFLDVAALRGFLTDAGFRIEAQYGDWDRGPVTAGSREIITIARRVAGRADAEGAGTVVVPAPRLRAST